MEHSGYGRENYTLGVYLYIYIYKHISLSVHIDSVNFFFIDLMNQRGMPPPPDPGVRSVAPFLTASS